MSELSDVTKDAYEAFLLAYPRELERHVVHYAFPPVLTHNDFTLGEWPQSVVASKSLAVPEYDPPIVESHYRIMAR